MDHLCTGWQPTDVRGLEVRSDGSAFVAIRLHGREALLPLSLIQGATAPPERELSRCDEAPAGIGAHPWPAADHAGRGH